MRSPVTSKVRSSSHRQKAISLLLAVCLLLAVLAAFPGTALGAITITEVPVPGAGTQTFGVTNGPDGALWFTEYGANKIGRYPYGGNITTVTLPHATSRPAHIIQGPDGALWFTEYLGNRIGRITTAGAVSEFPIPTAGGLPWGIAVGADGNIWFTETGTGRVGRVTMAGVITDYPIAGATDLRGIVSGPDNAMWAVEGAGNRVDRISTGGVLTDHWDIATPNSNPWEITVGADGNLWFTEYNGNQVVRCTTAGAMTPYALPNPGSIPIGINPGPDGALWFAEQGGNRIGRCSLTGAITETAVPTGASEPMDLCNAPDGSIWFGETTQNTLGRLDGYDTPTWYLAEGSTDWGYQTYISIENPNAVQVHAAVTYMPSGAAPVVENVTLPARSQLTLTNDHLVAVMDAPRDFSTRIVCAEGRTIAADRTMQWTGTGASSPESHSSVGVTTPARKWYLAEGSTNWGFETFLLIQNPTPYDAECRVTYMIQDEAPQTFTKTVPASSRQTYNMAADIGAKDASIQVVSSVPVIPERAMYRNNRREGHDSIGTPTPAVKYYLAEGSTNWGFEEWLLIQNPNAVQSTVVVTYQSDTNSYPQPAIALPPRSRTSIHVNAAVPGQDLSTTVQGTMPIIAERAMYLPSASGEICHDSIGFTATHTSFYLPDGQTTDGRETFTLVQNPNGVPVNIHVEYNMAGAIGNHAYNYTIGANRRVTYPMIGGASGRGSVKVSCTSGQKIMVERAMYWNSRQAATDTIGGFTD